MREQACTVRDSSMGERTAGALKAYIMRDNTTGNLAYWKRVILWRNRPTGIRKAQGMRKQEEGIPIPIYVQENGRPTE